MPEEILRKPSGANVKLGTFVLLVILVAVAFGGAGYLYGINAGKTLTTATKTATATATVSATTSKTATASTTTTTPVTVSGEAKAKESCQSLAGSGVTVTISKYVNGESGEFASCGYENATTILKNINGTWTKIWRGNGDVTCTIQQQYSIPDSIIVGGCI